MIDVLVGCASMRFGDQFIAAGDVLPIGLV